MKPLPQPFPNPRMCSWALHRIFAISQPFLQVLPQFLLSPGSNMMPLEGRMTDRAITPAIPKPQDVLLDSLSHFCYFSASFVGFNSISSVPWV